MPLKKRPDGKFDTLYTKEECLKAKDGLYKIKNQNKTLCSDFSKEKDFVHFVTSNVFSFVRLLFNDEVISFETEYNLDKQYKLYPRGRRIDLFIVGRKKKYVIEAKNPKFGTESRAAIGQILDYGRELNDKNIELVIITTHFDINTAKTIKYYNLPIRYVYLSKKFFVEYLRSEE